jgi:hypothetical protein
LLLAQVPAQALGGPATAGEELPEAFLLMCEHCAEGLMIFFF